MAYYRSPVKAGRPAAENPGMNQTLIRTVDTLTRVIDAADLTAKTKLTVTELTGKAKLISDKGLGILSNNSGGLIGNNSAGVVSDQGGSLISDHGGGLVRVPGGPADAAHEEPDDQECGPGQQEARAEVPGGLRGRRVVVEVVIPHARPDHHHGADNSQRDRRPDRRRDDILNCRNDPDPMREQVGQPE